mgnify:CR=1 FL=1
MAKQLFLALNLSRARVRLVGVSLENLTDSSESFEQMELGERDKGWREVQGAIDRAISRFGRGSVTPARLVDEVESEDPEPSQSD